MDAWWRTAFTPLGHPLFILQDPERVASLDVHRWIVPRFLPWKTREGRFARALWDGSDRVEWQGVPVPVPAPADAVLISIALHRSVRDNDLWAVEVLDYTDLRTLMEGGLSYDEIEARARELGPQGLWRTLRERCDPEARRLDLRRPGRARRLVLALRSWPGRPFVEGEVVTARLIGLPISIFERLTAAMHIVRALWLVRAGRAVEDALSRTIPPVAPARTSHSKRRRIVAKIRHLSLRLPIDPYRRCLVRSIAVATAVRKGGWPALVVVGVSRADGAAPERHAWVEVDGEPLIELREDGVRDRYDTVREYPSR